MKRPGTKGLTKSGLKAKKGSAREKALNNLINSQKVANQGTSSKTKYVLIEYYQEKVTSQKKGPKVLDIEKIEAAEAALLKMLEIAGKKGLKKSELRITNAIKEKAFNNLIHNRKVGNLGSNTRTRYVLIEYYQPLEIAYEHIESIAKTGKLDIFTRSNFERGLQGAVRAKMDEALDLLVKEGKLLKLKHGQNSLYYLHIAAVKDHLPEAPAATPTSEVQEPPSEPTPTSSVSGEEFENRVMAAYLELKLSGGFSDVEIYALQQKSGVDMDALKEFLLEQSRKGRAVLSGGDWSMSSENAREGAVYLDSRPYLLVRFKG